MSETFKETVQRLAHRTATKYTHVASNGAPEYSFTEAQLGVFADFLRDELAKGQEPVGVMSAGTFVHWHDDLVPMCGTKLYTSPFVAAPAGVPYGWKLVPEIPTEEMKLAARFYDGELPITAGACYRAMLSAAPAAPADAVAKDAGWQPIETAPKDGTEILMRFHGRRPYVTGVKWKGGCFVQLSDYSPVEFLTANAWMTLPAAMDAAMQGKESS